MSNRAFGKGLVCVTILLAVPTGVGAGRISETGEGIDYWVTRSVIFAEVTEVERLSSEQFFHGTHRLQVRPKATLTGKFDCARLPNLELGGWFDMIISSCNAPPKKGACIVAVVRERDGEFFVESSFIKFMPEGAGLVEVKDFSDPLVAEILTNVQRIRRRFPF